MGLAERLFCSGLRLFKPDWIVAFYFPVFGPLRAVATPLLYLLLLLPRPAERRRLRFDPGYFLFFVAILLSTVFAENTGRADPRAPEHDGLPGLFALTRITSAMTAPCIAC